MANEKKRDYKREYLNDSLHTSVFTLKIRNTTDSDIISQINKRTSEGYSRQGYIKALIRYDSIHDVLAAANDSNDSN